MITFFSLFQPHTSIFREPRYTNKEDAPAGNDVLPSIDRLSRGDLHVTSGKISNTGCSYWNSAVYKKKHVASVKHHKQNVSYRAAVQINLPLLNGITVMKII